MSINILCKYKQIYIQYNFYVIQAIENDYVHMRRADPKSVSPDDLHRYLMISK